ncbi:hypothetical protein COCSUDRAFT_33208 [Coccomyxa subellipsoidea C-169]|uniref:Uncharacterized protein n=1 Tax=Coccomyxa subellipsoidea (strain C-169) TaxID=574566 RepID=I0YX55_COCSC|nr:hypothetical protein COCSUDRAFT_33208 [Coccomyxa subellipsoidea C-169]EIE22974.1 hypothetical protein COCSUDRAFT_33208 [Coccomyxa subellipsoidea C-169]|eukprot:XP_005647518.1 hypothetical protein COCSUDRAFT_33208 [Coccomyxa subellipsoidea C-169]
MSGFNWGTYEVWRNHPMLNNNLKFAVPGLKWGAAAFAVYVAYDQIIGVSKKEAHH